MDKSYKLSNHKRFVQQQLIRYAKGMDSNALVLGGPVDSMFNYLQFIYDSVAKSRFRKITSYELKYDVFVAQKSLCDELFLEPEQKIRLRYGNVIEAAPERFIDLDLMGTAKTCGDVVMGMFEKQAAMNVTCNRIFSFTLCQRGGSTKEHSAIEEAGLLLKKMLGCEVKYHDFIQESGGREHLWTCSDVRYIIRSYGYRDGAPMLSFLISY